MISASVLLKEYLVEKWDRSQRGENNPVYSVFTFMVQKLIHLKSKHWLHPDRDQNSKEHI